MLNSLKKTPIEECINHFLFAKIRRDRDRDSERE